MARGPRGLLGLSEPPSTCLKSLGGLAGLFDRLLVNIALNDFCWSSRLAPVAAAPAAGPVAPAAGPFIPGPFIPTLVRPRPPHPCRGSTILAGTCPPWAVGWPSRTGWRPRRPGAAALPDGANLFP